MFKLWGKRFRNSNGIAKSFVSLNLFCYRKQDLIPHSPDLQVTVAGSTFYGLSSSHSATDVPSSHDMGDYRRTSDR